MASEFAVEEGCPIVPGVPEDKKIRRRELRDLESKLDAVKSLQNYNEAIQYRETYSRGSSRYFLIQYDYEKKIVTVEPFSTFTTSAERYISEEKNSPMRNTVLVEADRVDDLRAAYPNYFLDVQAFNDRLKDLIFSGNTPPKRKYREYFLKDWKRQPV
jgi:hypothetical protein